MAWFRQTDFRAILILLADMFVPSTCVALSVYIIQIKFT
jgi:hypothetical protein